MQLHIGDKYLGICLCPVTKAHVRGKTANPTSLGYIYGRCRVLYSLQEIQFLFFFHCSDIGPSESFPYIVHETNVGLRPLKICTPVFLYIISMTFRSICIHISRVFPPFLSRARFAKQSEIIKESLDISRITLNGEWSNIIYSGHQAGADRNWFLQSHIVTY